MIERDRLAVDAAILTGRPWRRLPYRPGQALPVCTPRLHGLWRWLPAAKARGRTAPSNCTLVLSTPSPPACHIRYAREQQPWVGPPFGTGLLLDPSPPPADLLLVAGGTGLAQLRALVEQVAASLDGRRLTLVVGARTVADPGTTTSTE